LLSFLAKGPREEVLHILGRLYFTLKRIRNRTEILRGNRFLYECRNRVKTVPLLIPKENQFIFSSHYINIELVFIGFDLKTGGDNVE